MTCDDVRAALVPGAPSDPRIAAHVAGCAECGVYAVAAERVGAALAADPAPAPPTGLGATVLRAATPLLARHAHRAARERLVRALGAALVPLPLILVLDVGLLTLAYDLLSRILPATLSLYLVVNHALLLALLLGLTYGAVPLLAARQAGAPARETA